MAVHSSGQSCSGLAQESVYYVGVKEAEIRISGHLLAPKRYWETLVLFSQRTHWKEGFEKGRVLGKI